MKEHVIINRDRSVTVQESLRKLGVQYDHNVTTITFDCPRYPDEDQTSDMSQMNVFVNYMLADKTVGVSKGVNITVDPDDQTIMHFDWIITRSITKFPGVISTLVCIKHTDENGDETYHWNTDLFQRFTVGNGMEIGEIIADERPDIITYILKTLDTTNAEMKMKLTQPDTAKVGQIFVVKSINDDGTLVLESADKPEPGTTPHIGDNGHWWIGDVDTGVVAGGGGSGAVEDVQVNGESIVQDGVAEIPISDGYNKLGLVKSTSIYGGLSIINGDISCYVYSDGLISNRSESVPVTAKYADLAVKCAMCDGKGKAWTADEQAAARERMSVYSADNWVKLIDIELTEEAEIQCLNAFKPVYSKFCFKVVRNQTTNPETRNTQVQLKRNTETMVLSHQSFSSSKTKCSTRGHLELYKFSDDPKKYYRCLGVYTAGESENFDTLDPQGSANYMYGYALSDLPDGIVVTGVHGVGTRLVLWGCR